MIRLSISRKRKPGVECFLIQAAVTSAEWRLYANLFLISVFRYIEYYHYLNMTFRSFAIQE